MKTIKVNTHYLTLFLLSITHILINWHILKNDSIPLVHDGAGYFAMSLDFYHFLAQNQLADFCNYYINLGRPPLFMLTSLPFYLVFGKTPDIASMSNALYLLILLFSTYHIGKKLYSKNTGLLASFFISTFPIVFGFSRMYWVDFALTGMVALSICLLLHTGYFANRRFSFYFGLSLGLGMLTKQAFFVFIIGPFVYYLLAAAIKKGKTVVPNIALSIFIGLAVASTYYLPNFVNILSTIIREINGDYLAFSIDTPGVHHFFEYFRGFYFVQLYPVYSLLFIGSFFYYIFFLKDKTKIFFLITLILPLLFFVLFFHIVVDRYLMPYLPIIALVISRALTDNKSPRLLRFLSISSIIVFASGQFLYLSFRPEIGSCCSHEPVRISRGLLSSQKEDWKENQILSILRHDVADMPSIKNKLSVRVLVFPCVGQILSPLVYNAMLEDFEVEVNDLYCRLTHLARQKEPRLYDPSYILSNILLNNDYILLVRGKLADLVSFRRAHHSFKEVFRQNIDKFELIKTVELPKGLTLYIYKNKEPLLSDRYTMIQAGLNLMFSRGEIFAWNENALIFLAEKLASFRYRDKLYSSANAVWKIQKATPGLLQAKGFYEDLPGFVQILEIEITQEARIILKLGLEVDETINFSDLTIAGVYLSLSPEYKRYLSVNEKGEFRDLRNSGVILRDATTKFIGLLNDPVKKEVVPNIFLYLKLPEYALTQLRYSPNERSLFYWFDPSVKSSYEQLASLFRLDLEIISDRERQEGLIRRQKEQDLDRRKNLQKLISLERDNTRLFFDYGLGRIYFRDRELTSGFGIYTSMSSGGYWHDSQNMLWKIIEMDGDTLLVRGEDIYMPVVQVWRLKLIDARTIQWKVDLEIAKKVKLDKTQANIILNEDYMSGNSKDLELFTADSLLPARIRFELGDKNTICNQKSVKEADFLDSKAPVLRYYSNLNKEFGPGKYENYFEGKIILEE
ncbi:MAG: glycosyltransferase family 39 protein [Candidatus Omnitrophica bacterium]|nr:glycosyltransferase family 39 protein [Candidatus Omnitrophota bacterium]